MIDCRIHELAILLEKKTSKNLQRTPKQRAKVTYAIEITIAELSKLAVLIAVFTLTGNAVKFWLLFAILTVTRSFIGGIHAGTYLGCLIMSLCFFGVGVWIIPYRETGLLFSGIAFIVYLAGVIILAPVQSPNRPVCSSRRRIIRKIAAVMFSIISYIIIIIAAPRYIMPLLYVCYFQLAGAAVTLIRRRLVQ